MRKDYFLGLDIGTNSIGWVATDTHYNLFRKKGHDLWGIRRFIEGTTAKSRRVFRSARKRTDRKRARLQLLREIFENEINQVDNTFYLRLNESKYWAEDKKVKGKYALFNDKSYTDEEYYKEYPTIFHLRKALMDSCDKKDIRLYFLAINQMMKRRGHFLFDGDNFGITENAATYKQDFLAVLNDCISADLDESTLEELLRVVVDKNISKNDRKTEVKAITKDLNYKKEEQDLLTTVFNMLISGNGSILKIISDKNIEDKVKEDKKDNISFTDENFDDNVEYFSDIAPDKYNLIIMAKSVYDALLLEDLLKGHKSISEAQISRYRKHYDDLKKLKTLIRKYDDKKHTVYYTLFKDKKAEKGYVAYLGYYRRQDVKTTIAKKCTYSDFLENIKKVISNLCNPEDILYKEIIKDIENEEFLQKQIVSTNSVIPHQVHFAELEIILQNLVRDYPSFNKVDNDGISAVEKIKMLFNFKIPYYVGSLNAAHKDQKGSNVWIVKNKGFENEPIRPWNFDKVVNKSACEVEFIKRMLNQCTYLVKEKVLPKSSLLYSEYMVHNELNNLKINDVKLTPEMKKALIDEILLTGKKGTIKRIKQVLLSNNFIDKADEINISGIDEELKGNLKSHVDKKKIFGDSVSNQVFEDIIELITIHSDKTILSSRIKELVHHIDDKQLKAVLNLKYKDWGRLSRKLLSEIEVMNHETGEVNTVIEFLRNGDENLAALMSSRYSLSAVIAEENGANKITTITYDIVEGLYASPAVKKMIWQVIKITDEIIKVIGYKPKKIFIEMPRGKDEKPEKKESRKKQLLQLYKNAQKEIEDFSGTRDWKKELENKEEAAYRSKSLFLYYTQLGRCAYSGEEISLSQLFDHNLYDIDHIIPQKLKKDDSILNNLVLVKKNLNQSVKQDFYPVPAQIRNNDKVKQLWLFLVEKKFITKEKYDRLVRSLPLSDREKADFISRQLVETRQTTKLVADLFKQVYGDEHTKVVYVNAKLSSEYRQKNGLVKCRDINDLHHAHDAYLNIVVGNGWDTKFNSNPYQYVVEHSEYSLKHIFDNTIKNRKGEVIWAPQKDKERIRKILEKPSMFYTVEPYEESGALYNATIVGKNDIKEGTVYLPLKKESRLQNIGRYGAYNNIAVAYFFLVEHQVKGKLVRTLESMPVYLAQKAESDKNVLVSYCSDVLGLVAPKIIIRKVLKKSRVKIDGFEYLLNGKSLKQIILEPAMQKFFTMEETEELKKVLRNLEKSKLYKKDLFEEFDRGELEGVIVSLISKIKGNLFKRRKANPLLKFELGDKLNTFSNYEMAKLVKELIKLLICRNEGADLQVLGGSKSSGSTKVNKNISEANSFILINQSVTGIYSNEVDLKTWDGEQS